MSSPYETMAACRQGCGGRDNRGQKEEMAEMRREIEELSQVVQALLRQGRTRANREVPGGNSEPVDIPEGSQEDECDEECKENLFHDACYANMDSIAVEDSSMDWETPPIYDEYEGDDGDFLFKGFEEISTSETLPFSNESMDECSQNLFDEHAEQGIHFLEEAGFSSCETVESFSVHPVEPLTFYADPFLMDVCCSSTVLLTLETNNCEVKLKTTMKVFANAAYMFMYVNYQRHLNSTADRIISQGKIRGRIFSNKRSMMQCNPAYIFVFNWFLTINHWIPKFSSMKGLLDDAGACYLAVK